MADITSFTAGEWSGPEVLTADSIVQAHGGPIAVSTSGGSQRGIILQPGDAIQIGSGNDVYAKAKGGVGGTYLSIEPVGAVGGA